MAPPDSTKTDSGRQSPQMRPPLGHVGAGRDGLFFQLFEVSPVPAVVTRVLDHRVLAINARTSEIFDIPQDEAVGFREDGDPGAAIARPQIATGSTQFPPHRWNPLDQRRICGPRVGGRGRPFRRSPFSEE